MSDTDTTDDRRFFETEGEDQHVVYDALEADARTHDADKASEPHTHDETHIIFVRTGEMHWRVGDEEFDAKPGDTIVTPAGTEHKFETISDEPAKTMCLITPARDPEDRGPSGTHEITKPDEE
jgi:mannose-6-phosphate isomerase-like protein (cupin superfamily)